VGPGPEELRDEAMTKKRRSRQRKSRLPTRFHAVHEYAFFLHDHLVNIVVYGEQYGGFDDTLELISDDHEQELASLAYDDQVSWLLANGYKEQLKEIALRRLYSSILSDLCHFVYEGLQCSAKEKLSVAFSLFRKPFKDNLLLLEWLLADPDDLITRFWGADSEAYAPDRVTPERKLEIMRAAIAASEMPRVVDAQFLYDVRYARKVPYSLEKLWNQATHIVTSVPAYKTEAGHLNFVFGDEEEHLWLWDCLYITVPFLLFYTVELADALMRRIISNNSLVVHDDRTAAVDRLRRQLGFVMVAGKLGGQTKELLSGLMEIDQIPCNDCGTPIQFNLKNLENFSLSLTVECGKCGRIHELEEHLYPNDTVA
jgi:hypothetical protein